MKKFLSIVLGILFFVPSVSFAASLTPPQVNAIISLLEAFGVSPVVIAEVQAELVPAPQVSVTPPSSSTVAPQPSVSPSPVVSNAATFASAVGPAPQFVAKPSITYDSDTDTVTWQTTVPSTAVFYLTQSNSPTQSLDPNTIQQSWDQPTTSFETTQPRRRGVYFYDIVITANGISTSTIGQLPGY